MLGENGVDRGAVSALRGGLVFIFDVSDRDGDASGEVATKTGCVLSVRRQSTSIRCRSY